MFSFTLPPAGVFCLKAAAFFVLFVAFVIDPADGGPNVLAPGMSWAAAEGRPVWLRIGVLETDVWMESAADGNLFPQANYPLARHESGLMKDAHFTPEAYLRQIQRYQNGGSGRFDVLMYYGGRRQPGPDRQGLNLNAWTSDELKALSTAGGRPFVGLETTDPALVTELVQMLSAGGFRGSRLFVRITSEPSHSAYGTLDGKPRGERHTAATYRAYQKRFTETAKRLRMLGERAGITFKIVFAGDTAEDFDRYMPDPNLFDAIGFDLYVTPANIQKSLGLLRRKLRQHPGCDIVIPEFGIATAGEASGAGYRGVKATPTWARAALMQTLGILSSHSGHVTQLTLFSVNVAGRLESRRWSWAWTPAMFDVLEEWQMNPQGWRPRLFHRWDLESYPLDQMILYRANPAYRIYYRRLTSDDESLFEETRLLLRGRRWERTVRHVLRESNGRLILFPLRERLPAH